MLHASSSSAIFLGIAVLLAAVASGKVENSRFGQATQPTFPGPSFAAVVDAVRIDPVYPSRKDLLLVSPIGVRIDAIDVPRGSQTLHTLIRRHESSPSGWITVTLDNKGKCTFTKEALRHPVATELLIMFEHSSMPGFPSDLAQIEPPSIVSSGSSRSSKWFETTLNSQVPDNATWGAVLAPVSYCRNEWNRRPNHHIRGCDAQQIQTVGGRPKTIIRVHEKARSSFDRSWSMRTTLNYSSSVPDPSMFDLPGDWENACLNGRQRFLVEPGQARVATPTGDDHVNIRLQAPPAPGLGEAHITLSHGGYIETIPSKLAFTLDNWDQPQRVTLRYVREGEGSVRLTGKGGGIDRVHETRFYMYACHGTPGWGCDRSE